ncbi:MAG: hypothetical protein H0V14_01155 [Chitinophagaceae bacterium]|nr:hypothetical protein [Chitinophagaceae bacterium]
MKKIIFSFLLLSISNIILAQTPVGDTTGTSVNSDIINSNNQMPGDSANSNMLNGDNDMIRDTTGRDTINKNMPTSDDRMMSDTAMNSNMNNSNNNNMAPQGDSSMNNMNNNSNMTNNNNNMATQGDSSMNNNMNNNNQVTNNLSTGTGMNTGLSSAGYVAAPQMQTFVAEDVVSKVKSKYGDLIYDITSIKSAAGTAEYVIRVLENGQLRTQYIGEDANPIVR